MRKYKANADFPPSHQKKMFIFISSLLKWDCSVKAAFMSTPLRKVPVQEPSPAPSGSPNTEM